MIVKWETGNYSSFATRREFDRETAAFWWNGQRRTAKWSRYLHYFDTEEAANAYIAHRAADERRKAVCRNLMPYAPELLEAFREANTALCALLDKYPDEMNDAMCERIAHFGLVLAKADATK